MNTAPFFDFYYKQAKINSIVIMDQKVIVIDVNQAFTNNFGYTRYDIAGKHFSILFTREDKQVNKPQQELDTVISTGQANDENYVVNKEGHAIWCTGESILVRSEESETYIVKDILNLQAKQQLQFFLNETESFFERVFETTKDIPILVLDGSLKIVKVNQPFLKLFELEQMPESGSRLPDLGHPFWKSNQIRLELSNVITSQQPFKQRMYFLEQQSGEKKAVTLDSKVIEASSGKKIYIIAEEVYPTIKANT